MPVCWAGNQDGSKRESKARKPTTAIAAPTDRIVRRSASRSCAARERANTPTKMSTRAASSRLRSLLGDHEMPSAVQAANASSRPTPASSARPNARTGSAPTSAPSSTIHQIAIPDFAADDDVIAGALQGQVEHEHERQNGAGEDRSQPFPQSRKLGERREAAGAGRAGVPHRPRVGHGLGRLRHRNVRYAVPPRILTLSAFDQPIRINR